ncbi:MAG: hypothetical protein L0191_14860, partial [Acidobacteria bacterium]|nr:hypothetical protein [Acidobacteriota bacterium]
VVVGGRALNGHAGAPVAQRLRAGDVRADRVPLHAVAAPDNVDAGAAVLLNATLKEERVELKWLVANAEGPGG